MLFDVCQCGDGGACEIKPCKSTARSGDVGQCLDEADILQIHLRTGCDPCEEMNLCWI
jgi:hypothetical protein